MKTISPIIALLAALASCVPVPDDDCEMQWVFVYSDESPTSSITSLTNLAASRTTSLSDSAASSTATTAASIGDTTNEKTSNTPTSGFGNAPTAPGPGFKAVSCSSGTLEPLGIARFPIDGDNWCAPISLDPVPDGAAIYTPPDPPNFDTNAFRNWALQQQANKLESKFLKIAPGTYTYNLGPVHAPGTDTNTVRGTNIVLDFFAGDWTLDLRGVTFVIQITAENDDRRPGQMIYMNQSEGFTILGGTIWIDVGPIWSYARMKSVDASRVGTFEVLEGYNRSVFRTANGNYWCADDSDPNHTTHPSCQPWRHSTFDYSRLESDGIIVAAAPAWGNASFNPGFIMGTPLGPSMRTAVASENNGNFTIKGMTTNGNFAQYGLNPPKTPAVLEDVWIVQPPSQPGFAHAVQGPVWQGDNLGWANFHPSDEANMIFKNSYWQTSGNPKDLQDMNDAAPVDLAKNGL